MFGGLEVSLFLMSMIINMDFNLPEREIQRHNGFVKIGIFGLSPAPGIRILENAYQHRYRNADKRSVKQRLLPLKWSMNSSLHG